MTPCVTPPKALLIILALSFPIVFASSISDPNFTNKHHRERRQYEIGEFGNLKCNRTIWKSVFEPHLMAEGKSLRNSANMTLQQEYEKTLADLKKWMNKNLDDFKVVCNLQTYLECNDEGRCICGTSNLPYKYVTIEDNTCAADRGSICKTNSDCATGLTCEDLFCGGSEAFIEEIDATGGAGSGILANGMYLYTIILIITLALYKL